jgi:hypothetical protein
MKILIPSKGRPDTIRTHKWLEKYGLDYKIILHDNQERNDYLKNNTIDPAKIIVSGAPKCLPAQREWMTTNLCEMGEWAIFLDDNISGFTAAQEDYYKKECLENDTKNFDNVKYNSVLSRQITALEFLEICDEMKEIGIKKRAFLCGFATTDNPLFRNKKFKYYSYVIGKAIIRKRTQIKYPETWYCQEDYYDMASHLLHFGKVLVNNFARPISRHYENGGIGDYDSRLPKKIQLNAKLMEHFPGLFRYNQKVNCPKEAEIILRLNTENQIEKWRTWMSTRKT